MEVGHHRMHRCPSMLENTALPLWREGLQSGKTYETCISERAKEAHEGRRDFSHVQAPEMYDSLPEERLSGRPLEDDRCGTERRVEGRYEHPAC